MKLLCSLLSILVLISSVFFAQAQETIEQNITYKTQAHKFDEFGKVKKSEFNKRYSAFLTELVKDCDLTGYIINYGNNKVIMDTERKIRTHPGTRRCSYGGLRIVVVNGGEAKKLKTVFWIVPQGAKPPTP